MLGASASTDRLVQQLRAKVARIVVDLVASRSERRRRRDWHSASALWPDMFSGAGDGK